MRKKVIKIYFILQLNLAVYILVTGL